MTNVGRNNAASSQARQPQALALREVLIEGTLRTADCTQHETERKSKSRQETMTLIDGDTK